MNPNIKNFLKGKFVYPNDLEFGMQFTATEKYSKLLTKICNLLEKEGLYGEVGNWKSVRLSEDYRLQPYSHNIMHLVIKIPCYLNYQTKDGKKVY